jgi:serine/threonine protein kinase
MTSDTARPPTIDVGELKIVKELGDGGQGTVYLVEPRPPADPAPVAFKRYKPLVMGSFDAATLAQLVLLLAGQDEGSRQWLSDRSAWPTTMVTDKDQPVGFLMQMAPPRFYKVLTLLSSGEPQLLGMEFLLNSTDYLTRCGIFLSDRHRVGLLRELASVLALLHEHGVAVGDLSPKNLVVSLEPEPRCFLLDCDAVRVRGQSVLAQADTPDWEIPAGEERATPATDVYKLALLTMRLFANDQSVRDVNAMPATFPELTALVRASLVEDPSQRPGLGSWIDALDRAMPVASSKTQSVPVASPYAPGAGTALNGPSLTFPAGAGSRGSSGRRTGLIVGGIIAVIAVILGIAVLSQGHSSANAGGATPTYTYTPPVNTTATVTTDDPTSPPTDPPTTATDDAAGQASALNDLLSRSETDRQNLTTVLNNIGQCQDLPNAQSAIQSVISGRTGELASAKALAVDALDNGHMMQVVLVSALTHSLAADKDYLNWAADVDNSGCTHGSLNDSHKRAGDQESRTATVLKRDFVNDWNPVAQQNNFPAQDQGDI